jgi:laminin alpha 3/5
VIGYDCVRCKDGYFGFGNDATSGCRNCRFDCDKEGTLGGVCDKANGFCVCKDGFYGARCDKGNKEIIICIKKFCLMTGTI